MEHCWCMYTCSSCMRWYGSNSSSKQVVRTQLWRRVATQLRAQQFRKLLVIHRVGTLVDYLSKHQTPSECHNWWIAKDASIIFHNQIPIVYSYYRDMVWWPPHLAQQIMFLAKHAQKIEPLYIYQQVCVSKISGGRGNGAILLDIMICLIICYLQDDSTYFGSRYIIIGIPE